MEDKLKARLTGAAILVALLVLVVPELFRGAAIPTAAPPAATTPTPDNAAPLNSYQIDLQPGASSGAATSAADSDVATVNAPEGGGGGAADAAPGSATTLATTAAPDAVASIKVTPHDAPPAHDPAASSSAPKVAGTHPSATAPVSAAPKVANAAVKSATAKPATVKSATAKAATANTAAAKPATVAPAAPAAGRGWSVRVGIFSKRDNAQRLRQQLQAKGVTVAVSGPDGRGLYSVAGPKLAERAAAVDWLKHVKSLGFAGVLTEAQ